MRRHRDFGFSAEEHERQYALLIENIDQAFQEADERLRRGECYNALRALTDGWEMLGQAKSNQQAGAHSTGARIAQRRARAAELRDRIVLCFAANCSTREYRPRWRHAQGG